MEIITAEIDERLTSAARELFAEDPRIEVITGDAFQVMSGHGPFELLFADSGVRDGVGFAALVSLLRIGGRIVMDDVTPECVLPPDSPLRSHDLKRQFFSTEPRLVSTEVGTARPAELTSGGNQNGLTLSRGPSDRAAVLPGRWSD